MASGQCTRGDSSVIRQIVFGFSYTVSANSVKNLNWDDCDLTPSDVNVNDHYYIITGYSSGNTNCIINRITMSPFGASTDFSIVLTVKNMSSSQRSGKAKVYITAIPKKMFFTGNFRDCDVEKAIFKSANMTKKFSVNSGASTTLTKDDFKYVEQYPSQSLVVGLYNFLGGNSNVTCRNIKADRESLGEDGLLAVKNTGGSDLSNITAELGFIFVRFTYYIDLEVS